MLAYTERGNPDLPPVLFLHGFLGCGDDWTEIAASLDAVFRCILPDLPGHGGSAAYEVADMPGAAASILELMDGLGLEGVALVGYSMGGRLALYLALQHPDRIARAVIESASPGLRSPEERVARQHQDEKLAAQLETLAFPVVLARWYTQPLFGRLFLKDRARFMELLERRLKNNPRVLAATLRGLGTGNQPSLWARLADNRAPMLFVAGEEDAKYTALALEMAAVCPESTAHIVPRCAHNVHFENPTAYACLLGDFLAE